MGYKKGDAPFPSTFEVDSNGALDARLTVGLKSDLLTAYTISGRKPYSKMVVTVENENAQYMLIDVSKVSSSDYSGWKLISSTTGANIDCGTF